MDDKHVASHDGHVIRHGNTGVRNSYEIWENSDGKYIKMKVNKGDDTFMTLFDYEDLKKVKNIENGTWFVSSQGYAVSTKIKKYLHHLVMDFTGTGRGFQQVSIDHINRNTLDNRKSNLRRATAQEQQANTKGIIEGYNC